MSADRLKGEESDHKPSKNCFTLQIGGLIKCPFLEIGGDRENPTFRCVHPVQKDKPVDNSCPVPASS